MHAQYMQSTQYTFSNEVEIGSTTLAIIIIPNIQFICGRGLFASTVATKVDATTSSGRPFSQDSDDVASIIVATVDADKPCPQVHIASVVP